MSWVLEGEKFVLLGLHIDVAQTLGKLSLIPGYSILQDSFDMPDHWKGWLGSQRVEDIEACSTYLAITMRTNQPSVLDGDDQRLRSLIGHWYWGCLLTGKFLTTDDPFIIAGSRHSDEIDVRHFEVMRPTGRGIVEHDPALTGNDLEAGAVLAQTLKTLVDEGASSNWRLLRCLAIYQEARIKNNLLDRVHQFVRCIEGLIVSGPGKGKRHFKSRTELFIGPQHHDFMGELYDLRSHIEHLYENQHLETFDRNVRLKIARKEAVSEFIARTCLVRILSNDELRKHFGNVDALRSFWQLEKEQQIASWGPPISPLSVFDGFEFDDVTDHELGKPH